jgi:ParB family chromosome partitioning protein
MFEVQADGRRYRALELLVKQKRMSKTQPVPCIVQTSGLAEEDSLAENVHRENLLGSVLQLSCWVRTDVMVLGDVSSGISSVPAA